MKRVAVPVNFVLWDHDGVLVDTEPLFFEATARALADHGVAVSHDRWAALQAAGSGIVRLLDEAEGIGVTQAEIRHIRDEIYAELLSQRDVLIPGAPPCPRRDCQILSIRHGDNFVEALHRSDPRSDRLVGTL